MLLSQCDSPSPEEDIETLSTPSARRNSEVVTSEQYIDAWLDLRDEALKRKDSVISSIMGARVNIS